MNFALNNIKLSPRTGGIALIGNKYDLIKCDSSQRERESGRKKRRTPSNNKFVLAYAFGNDRNLIFQVYGDRLCVGARERERGERGRAGGEKDDKRNHIKCKRSYSLGGPHYDVFCSHV